MKIRIIILIVFIILAIACALLYAGRKVNVDTNKNVEGLSKELQEVFYLAALSPSSHNIQSWIINVYPEKDRDQGGSWA